jgi:GT2 family glycosyltransferase
MTLAPPHGVTDSSVSGASPAAVSVTAMLVLRGPVSALPQTLDSLARQTRAPERLVVVDLGRDGNAVETVRAHEAVSEVIPNIRFITVYDATTLSAAVAQALIVLADSEVLQGDSETAPDGVVDHLWLLTNDSAAAPTALARLLDAVRRSPSVGVAGPKLLDWDRPGRLRAVGIQLTRSGRLIPSPMPGEPDQGQYDRRTDVLAVPATGMLVERELFESLSGPEGALGRLGGDVDFGWRAQQAGRRVVVVPRATVRTDAPAELTDTDDSRAPQGEPVTRLRRQARRAALARCSLLALPFLALWILVSSTVAALGLLLAKRPRAAWAEFSDIGAVLTPARVIGARWRSRGTRQVRRRDLAGLFVGPTTVLRHAGDLIHDQVSFEPRPDEPSEPVAVESGPVADEAEDLNVLGSTWASRAARNPGLLAVVVATVVATMASRQLGGTMIQRFQQGVAGGELVGVRATPGSLWHLWLDGWHGGGLGQAGEQGPHLVVLAGLAWLVSHLPVVGAPSSPAGAAIAVLTGLALPLATLTAYLGARVVTHSRWPRALAALAWSTSAVLTSAVAAGRIGGIVAAILLPLVAAGYALCARRGGTATVTAATILATAVAAAFLPALLVVGVVAGLAVVVLGRGAARLRGLALAVGPVLLLGPWVATLADQPALLLTGPGLSVWGTTQAAPWQLALLHPGGPASTPVMLSAPIVLAGLFGLLRGGAGRGRGGWVLAVMALTGLAAALVAPRIHLGTVPVGTPHEGAPITAWAGTGLLLMLLALLAAALLGSAGLPVRQAGGGWLALARWPVAAAVIATVVLSSVWTAWHTLGDTLHAWTDERPAVAIDQAEGGLGNRMLLLEPDEAGLAYRLVGREPSDVARSLPDPARSDADQADHLALATAVSALFEQGAAPGELHPARDLSAQAVGFVGLRTDPSDPRIRALDATAGLSRLGDHDGVIFWRVLAGGGTDDSLAPSRARVVAGQTESAVPVSGDHARLHATVIAPAGSSLVLAEPQGWTRHARVSVDGRALAPEAGGATYALPAGRSEVTVNVLPTDTLWRYAQGVAFLLAVFVAIPLGARPSRRRA